MELKFLRISLDKLNYLFEVRIPLLLTKFTVFALLDQMSHNTLVSKPFKAVFISYPSVDVWAIHQLVSMALRKNSKSCIDTKFIWSSYQIPVKDDYFFSDAPQIPITYQGKISYILDKSGGDANIARGMIDQYRRMCDKDEFIKTVEFNHRVLREISNAISRAKYIATTCDVLIIPDLAYAFNRAAVSFMKQKGGAVFILSADGRFFEVEWEGDFAIDLKSPSKIFLDFENLSFEEKDLHLRKAIQYTQSRLSGKSADIESRLAFQESSHILSDDSSPIFFLHCIRDASNDNPFMSPGNEDYFIWTRNVIQYVARNKFDCQIKLHPSLFQYPDEEYLIYETLKSYGLSPDDYITSISTAQVLKGKRTVLTFSGTISLETAHNGYKSFCFGHRFSDELCIVTDFDSLESDLVLSRESKLLSNESVNRANLVLYENSREFQAAHFLTLRTPILPNTSKMFRRFSYVFCLKEILDKRKDAEFEAKFVNLLKFMPNIQSLSCEEI